MGLVYQKSVGETFRGLRSSLIGGVGSEDTASVTSTDRYGLRRIRICNPANCEEHVSLSDRLSISQVCGIEICYKFLIISSTLNGHIFGMLRKECGF